ncbi:hypothetical protein KL930_000510 [Ogataea haglerorum]|nr:hypothetical protein KL915_000069 [Ogataea haglerorum]KAG7706057.1 hypothetical protein KL950_003633 [Ogataea haglerorum]KAG7741446.1 hypothetical protein KL932_002733 [Ogataea haglerorum]KAG7756926.1 hypothetical protein KL947_003646 [Ogataea haglerorum]KAG7777611.1 hypothetical protein KL922_003001 [Ogataea haglerorum]
MMSNNYGYKSTKQKYTAGIRDRDRRNGSSNYTAGIETRNEGERYSSYTAGARPTPAPAHAKGYTAGMGGGVAPPTTSVKSFLSSGTSHSRSLSEKWLPRT